MEIIVILLVLLSIYLYFIPSVIAVKRNHRNQAGIIVLNIFSGCTVILVGWTIALLGGTLLFWVAALVWSLSYQEVKHGK